MPRSSPVEAHHFQALGSNCAVSAVGRSRPRLLEAEFWVRRLGARLTRFSPGSELSRFNNSPGRWQDIGRDLESLLRESLRAFESSMGLVNVAVLRSMEAVGDTRTMSEGRPGAIEPRACPPPALPNLLGVRPGTARLEPRARIDLGGIPKRWM